MTELQRKAEYLLKLVRIRLENPKVIRTYWNSTVATLEAIIEGQPVTRGQMMDVNDRITKNQVLREARNL